MKKLLIVIMLLFIGCGQNLAVLQKDEKYSTLTQYTQRGQITRSLETIALINATYLNPILKDTNETQNNEIFIIGVYNSNDYKGYEKGGIHNPHYKLTMNDMNYTKAIKADVKKLNLTDYPFYNKWMKYYQVYFPKTDSKILKITYSNEEGNVTLEIPKDIYSVE